MDISTAVKIADGIVPHVCDTDSMSEADCTTELERVLYQRLTAIREHLERLGINTDSRGAFVKERNSDQT